MSPDKELEEAFCRIINMRSRERYSNTPDFVIARYLINCLRAYEDAARRSNDWKSSDKREVIDVS